MKIMMFAAILVLSSLGCDSALQPGTTAAPQKSPQPYQRFVPLPNKTTPGLKWEAMYALDTKTGQLCRTLDWDVQGQRTLFDDLPLCVTLYHIDQN